MITTPKAFLLCKIMESNSAHLPSLFHLETRFIDDVSEVLKEYAEMAYKEGVRAKRGRNKQGVVDKSSITI